MRRRRWWPRKSIASDCVLFKALRHLGRAANRATTRCSTPSIHISNPTLQDTHLHLCIQKQSGLWILRARQSYISTPRRRPPRNRPGVAPRSLAVVPEGQSWKSRALAVIFATTSSLTAPLACESQSPHQRRDRTCLCPHRSPGRRALRTLRPPWPLTPRTPSMSQPPPTFPRASLRVLQNAGGPRGGYSPCLPRSPVTPQSPPPTRMPP